MSDNRKENKDEENRGGGAVLWLLLAVTATVVACAYLVNSTQYAIRYSDFVELVQSTQYVEKNSLALVDAPDKQSRLVVALVRDPKERGEYSKPHNISLAQNVITGEVFYRPMKDGKPVGEPKEVSFKTIRSALNSDEEQRLTAMFNDANISWGHSERSDLVSDWGPPLLMIAVIIALTVFMFRKIGGVGSPMSFGRSKGKLYAQEDLAITFKDVAGIDEAVEEVSEVVDFLKHSDKYQKLGGRIPKGVLLVGPPGTGKTMLAKAIAGEAGVPFFGLSGSDFVEMFVGVGAARVRDMFQQAASRAPCIIFIDEMDALGKSRGNNMMGGHDEREQTLNALLVEMDGFDSNTSVIVIAATNRPETLDPALMRPGRFDRHVLVDRPDIGGREEILKVHVKNVKLDEDVDLKGVASITSGFVGADLANLVNEAALLAARAGKKSVGMFEFNEGVERVTAGLEKKNRVMDQDEKVRVAYHEAGHALVACSLPNTHRVHKVSIIPRGLAALGYTMQRPEGDRYLMTQGELESQIKVLLGGTLTEEMVFSDISTGAQNDLERATQTARSMVMDYGMSRLGRINFRQSNQSAFLATGGEGSYARMHSEQTAREIDEEVKRIINEALRATNEILAIRRDALEAITQRLLEIESMDGDELLKIIETHSPGPRVVPGTVSSRRDRPASGGSSGENNTQGGSNSG
ncbi:ATP-dependent zinc metalloprotease FtsH [Rosistilla oblonga]|uniref:ATP-dependent zinc metalloprotease FtsH n=1 Tax=Rosistilla oblonga TaxID=2527990 RepID=UPI003A97190B